MELTPQRVAAGPWMQIDERGTVSIYLRLVPPIDLNALALIQPYSRGLKITSPQRTRVIPASGGALAGQIVVSWTLPPLTSGTLRLSSKAPSPDEPTLVQVEVPIPPEPTDAVAVAVTGSAAWPDASSVIAAGTHSGATISAMLVVGTVSPERVGTGGWEDKIPLFIRLDPAALDRNPLLAVILEPAPPAADVTWGCLGLPSLLRGAEVAVDIASRTRPWNVLLDPLARWDPALRALPGRGDPNTLRTPVGIAKMLAVPCILAGGSPAGFISEPLGTIAGGGLQVEAGGVRYLAATSAGDGLRQLDRFIAMGLAGSGLTVIRASPSALVMAVDGDVSLEWRHADAGTSGPGAGSETGPGEADVLALATAWRQALAATPADAGEPPAIKPDQRLLWTPRKKLATGEWNLLELFRLADSTQAEDRLLARRLVADPTFVGDEVTLLQRMPAWLQRDSVLRWLAEPGSSAQGWVQVAGATTDPMVLRALLAVVEGAGAEANGARPERAQAILESLVDRLAAQAAGRLAMDEDPLLQSRVTAAVFDAATLSPTPLRVIARELQPRLSPLGAQPVIRFLAREGRVRASP